VESPDGKFLYYSRNRKLWSIRREGGDERIIVEALNELAPFSVVQEGVYFVQASNPATAGSISFLNLAQNRITKIADMQRPAFRGLAVAPDRRTILFAQVDREESDLMLLESSR